MNRYVRTIFLVLTLVTLVLSGCGLPAPEEKNVEEQAQDVPTTDEYVETEEPVEYDYEAIEEPMAEESERYAAPAPPSDGAYPSTGGTTPPNDQPYADVFFDNYGVNPRIDTEDDHRSTFAVDVDTASYTVMRRYVNDGYLPPKDSVRVEEYVNFFEQEYAPPTEGAFAVHIEGAPSPYAPNYHLVRVGIQGYEVPPEERDDVVLTFIVDVSGSMDMENRLELVKDALALLVEQLRPEDKVGIVVYGNQARIVLEPTQVGGNHRAIFRAIDSLHPEGATNAEEGLVVGYRMAMQAFNPNGTNRVILCSDGVANVGNTGPESILEQIRGYADEGLYLTTVGFGMGNYNDTLMERLANDGDGFYAYVDDIKEAERVFVHDLTSSLQVIAKDAKIQVDFNPAVVSRYRLVGYENRDVADEDFRNDDVDAGEIGPGHSVTAIYEVKFHDDASELQPAMTVYIRYADPKSGEVTEINRAIGKGEFAEMFEKASARFQLAVLVAQYAEVLRESYWAKDADLTLDDLSWDVRRIAEYFPQDADVQEFAGLVERGVNLSATR